MIIRSAALAAFLLVASAAANAQSVQELDASTGQSVSEAGGLSKQMSSVQTLQTGDHTKALAEEETADARNEKVTDSVTAIFVAKRFSDESVAAIRKRDAGTPMVMRGGVTGGSYSTIPADAPAEEADIANNGVKQVAGTPNYGSDAAEPKMAAAPSDVVKQSAAPKPAPKPEVFVAPNPRDLPQ